MIKIDFRILFGSLLKLVIKKRLLLMKKTVSIIFYAIVAVALFLKAPTVFEKFKMQGQPAPFVTVKRLSGDLIDFPVPDQKMIVIFWATWCGPCKVELNRLDKLMANGIIKSNELIAINSGETAAVVSEFLVKNPWQFKVALDESGEIAKKFKVSGTPTVVFLDVKGQVEWITTGLSPSLNFRINRFLQD